MLIWIRDITEEKLLERSKSELVAVASHQLRTPLTVTKGNTEMLLDESFGPLTSEQRDIIKQTAESNERLIDLVNQMLDITKIDKVNLNLKINKVSLELILQNIQKEMGAYAEEMRTPIHLEKKGDFSSVIMGDGDRIFQVFQNLVENSIRYRKTDSKEPLPIVITLYECKGMICVDFTDQGIGIPKSEQKKIFERFYRASNAITAESTGTGLGLHLVKTVIEKLDGTIDFDSEEGKGTTFYIRFPAVID